MFSNLNKKEKRFQYMIMYLITVSILIYAIYIVQYDGIVDQNLALATSTVATIFGIMTYNYRLCVSFIFFAISGITSWLFAGIQDGQVVLLFALIGITVILVRATHGAMGTMMYFEKSPAKRFNMIFDTDYKLYRTEILHKLIILTIMITLVLNVSKDPSITVQSYGLARNSIMIALLACLPLFTSAVGCMGVEDMYPMYFAAYGVECVVLTQTYMVDSENIVPLYMATERLILMFTLMYSFYFGNKQREVEV